MNVTLHPRLEQQLHDRLTSGEYDTADDIINAALLAFFAVDRVDPLPPDEMRQQLQPALECAERGHLKPLDVEAILVQGRERLLAKSAHK